MEITKIETNKNKNLYFNTSSIKPKKYSSRLETQIVNIYPDVTYQKFIGFGGAITEASAYAYSLLPEDKKKNFINDYFSEINYSFCRLPIGSCDFSLGSYSYAYKHDLSDFSIEKDFKYIIPLIQDALKVNPNLHFLASPWSPPKFMKNTKMLLLGGKLSDKYKQTYANYLAKYITAYKDLGINIDYITIQNEPNAIQLWESCLYTAEDESDFLINYLHPTLKSNNLNTKIILYDHNKEKLYNRALETFKNPRARELAAGLAFHWYSGNHFENIELCRKTFPEMLLFHTEGCFGYTPNNSFANEYAHDIVDDLNAGINGYIDWNILLDSKGGPNHKNNFCNSPVMLNKENTNYIKHLAYYYIGHFSKVIKPGAVKIGYSRYLGDIRMTAFKNPDNTIAIVMLNREHYNIDFNLCINDIMFKDTLEQQSMISYVIK